MFLLLACNEDVAWATRVELLWSYWSLVRLVETSVAISLTLIYHLRTLQKHPLPRAVQSANQRE